MPTSDLVCLNGRQIVLDCGLGVTRGLVAQGMQLKDLSLILISHLHSDHYLELGPLLHTAWTAGLKTPVEVYGPPGLDAYWSAFLASMKADIDLRTEDEAPIAALADFARGADLLVHEAMLEAALMARIGNGSDKLMAHWLRSHSFAHDAAETATRARVKRLALSHLIPSDDPGDGRSDWQAAVRAAWSGPLTVGADGIKIDLTP